MIVDAELVKKVIQAHACDTLSAYNVGKTDKLYYSERKSATDLCLEVDTCVASIQGPFRIEVWKGERGKGRPSEKAAAYTFIVQGGHGVYGAPQHNSDMDARLARIEAALMNGSDEPEDEPINGPSERLVTMLADLLPRFLGQPGAAPSQPATAPPSQPVNGAPVNGEAKPDMEVMRAVMRLQKTDPNAFAQYREMLIKTYGDEAAKRG